ncbi:hypothetical protein MNEG_11923 [Monoraphidium neglectum]|uniref:Uncharacterized protein n=1 Tax=Monoraphidium neglectum TaxID=145388 RepID=A0A0D2KJM2_9CHLO|nr:hypothetical protein MNEG_11923 [Monoraphidium neglectum]KIY96038.1 hypothetical protein MNEG_11923 [Monoraphidium neglectum]|eukprot:XP_013895058.1 hypothetical protein MNEG_11923 [Monoraphidium neglectum]
MAPQFKGGVPGGSGRNMMRLKGRVLPLRTAALAVGAAAAVGGVGALHHHHRTARLQHSQHGPAFLLPRGLAEVICGAVGEIVQLP